MTTFLPALLHWAGGGEGLTLALFRKLFTYVIKVLHVMIYETLQA
jgi:hypothetical protein